VSGLSHVGDAGDVRMVDVGGKPLSRRRALARSSVRMAPKTAERLRDLPKGDALVTAQLAGIMAAKRTGELIPLCHPLGLDHVQVEARLDPELPGVRVTAAVRVTGRTGVEMEALTAVTVACLTVYDMVKAVDKGMIIEDVKLVSKTKRPSHSS
jgi:cyclic pyranopterin phosphate synthase